MKQLFRPIGIHARMYDGLQDVVEAVTRLDLSVVQSFLITENNNYVPLHTQIIDDFLKAKRELSFLYYVHAAYWSGLTDCHSKMFQSLKKEIEITQDLHADGIVIHPGAIKGRLSDKDKVRYVAESVNLIHDKYPKIQLLLENAPHAGRTFGGKLEHFAMLFEYVEQVERLGFCIDTAHAFVYGYDLGNEMRLTEFLQQLKDFLGKKYIKLLHFNDAKDRCGSYIDKHEEPGFGLIGKNFLQTIMNHDLFVDIPLIIECSKESRHELSNLIKQVKSWQ